MKSGSHNRTDRVCSRQGFTLVDLLVALAVITVLMAVLMPVALQARNRAHAVTCVSNLRQIGVALGAYADDWRDRLPTLKGTPFAGSRPSAQWPDGSSTAQLRSVLSAYLKDDKVLRCASDLGAAEFGFSPDGGSVFARTGSSYACCCGPRAGQYGVAATGGTLSSMQPAQEHVLMRDYGSGWHGYHSRVGMNVTSRSTANCLFADGHVTATPVLRMAIGDRHYACLATSSSAAEGLAYLCGASGDHGVLLSGRRRIVEGGRTLEISLSGSVYSGGVDYSVDRVFRFSADTRIDPALRQIVNWVDSLVAG